MYLSRSYYNNIIENFIFCNIELFDNLYLFIFFVKYKFLSFEKFKF